MIMFNLTYLAAPKHCTSQYTNWNQFQLHCQHKKPGRTLYAK